MPLSFAYWITMLVWLVVAAVWGWRDAANRWWVGGFSILVFILFVLVGLKIFGGPIQGG